MATGEEQQPATQNTPVVHAGITCDECGACPLVGIRYKARHIYDFDVCETCMEELDSTERENYAPIENVLPHDEADELGPPLDGSGIHEYNVGDAATAIGRNECIEHARLEMHRIYTEDEADRLETAIASNTHLRFLHIHQCFSWGLDDSTTSCKLSISIARGIRSNTSIERVFWSIPKKLRLEPCATALSEMIEGNSTLQALYLDVSCGEERADFGSNTPNSAEDAFAQAIFRGLTSNQAIRKFRLESCNPLSEESKEILFHTLTKNRKLERVLVESGGEDSRLELLLTCNRKNWMERMLNTDAAIEDRVDVIAEALKCDKSDPVSAAYHLLRGCPDVLKRSPVK